MKPPLWAVSSSDNQLKIWDISLEKGEEEETKLKSQTREQVNAPENLPPQLLFVHQGRKDLKELHWHAQIPTGSTVGIKARSRDASNALTTSK